VADSIGAIEGLEADDLFQVAELAFGAANLQAVSVTANRNTRRVVAAIFQSPQAVKNDRHHALLTYITHDSAHEETAPE
jgi:hypothetical protein